MKKEYPNFETNYKIYNKNGKLTNFIEIINKAENYDIVLVGENHDDPVAHFLEKKFIEEFHKKFQKTEYIIKRKVILSFEIFETDIQEVLDEYMRDLITKGHFFSDSRSWHNIVNDYFPLLKFAKINKIPVIAANAPRRYVNLVSRKGPEALEKLSKTGKSWIAPLPYKEASEKYIKKIEKLSKQIRKQSHEKMSKKSMINNKKMTEAIKNRINKGINHYAQSLWDATMAWSISKAFKKNSGSFIMNINGRFHSEENLGIPDHIRYYIPEARILIITILSEKTYPKLGKGDEKLGDYIIITNPKLPRSYKY